MSRDCVIETMIALLDRLNITVIDLKPGPHAQEITIYFRAQWLSNSDVGETRASVLSVPPTLSDDNS